ncbi:MAG: sel1 repeat family protein [Planctomycetaceae bacterium]|jgi:TPR repeat protein|nr:sel1 repeat family protein [Planctomycetaceae bacterium]
MKTKFNIREYVFLGLLLLALQLSAFTGCNQLAQTITKLSQAETKVTIDWSASLETLQKYAEKDNPVALYILAECYRNGLNGCIKNEDKGSELHQRGSKLAKKGNPYAQCSRGNCYQNGFGVAVDEDKAYKWYRKAAEKEYAVAQCHLGYCYQHGEGVSKDFEEAVKWYRKAAKQGNAAAQNNLGYCYEYGESVSKDFEEAFK